MFEQSAQFIEKHSGTKMESTIIYYNSSINLYKIRGKMCKEKDKLIEKYREIDKSKLKILKELKRYKDDIKVKDNICDSKVCFVFSCPGERELIKNKVCAGQTGTNLNFLLSRLNEKEKDIFPNPDRYKYTIINASDKVHFDEYTGDNEASREEINNKNNIARIKKIIKKNNIKYVILFGKKAQSIKEVIEYESQEIVFAETIHLSNRSINSHNYKDKKVIIKELDTPEERKIKRLELIADEIIEELSK